MTKPPPSPKKASLIDQLADGLDVRPNIALIQMTDRAKVWLEKKIVSDTEAVLIYELIRGFQKKYKIVLKLDSDYSANDNVEKLEILVGSLIKNKSSLLRDITDARLKDAIERYEIAKDAEGTFGVARLDLEEKQVIHSHLSAIRSIVEESPLSERKKNALFERISDLAKEVDLAGTRTDRFFAFLGDLAFTSGEMAKNAKPAIDEFKKVMRIITQSRAKQENAKLPKPDDVPLLPGPTG